MKRLILAFCLALVTGLTAVAETIDFEQYSGYLGFVDVPGVVFQDFDVITASDVFPAHSGTKVATQSCCDFPPTLTFNQPVNTFSGYFNYYSTNNVFGLAITAFGADNQAIETIYTPYLSNLERCDCPFGVYDPNELLTLSSATPIYSIGFEDGDSEVFGTFSMDDISFSATPEPASLPLTASAILMLTFGYLLVPKVLNRARSTRT
jgi:hypothetical protein